MFLKFERPSQPLASWRRFVRRILVYAIVAISLDLFALLIGMLGFRFLEPLGWLESALNATMILTGNGPYLRPETAGAKLFQLCYALFSVFIFVMVVTVILAPVAHRILHAYRLEPEDRPSRSAKS